MTKLDTCIKWIDRMLQSMDLNNDRHDGASPDFPTWREQFRADLAALKSKPPAPKAPQISFDHEHGTWSVPYAFIENWVKAYPAVSVEREIDAAGAWLMANPKKAPRSNYARFLNGWLKRTQDRGGTRGFVQSNQTDKAEAWAKLNP